MDSSQFNELVAKLKYTHENTDNQQFLPCTGHVNSPQDMCSSTLMTFALYVGQSVTGETLSVADCLHHHVEYKQTDVCSCIIIL